MAGAERLERQFGQLLGTHRRVFGALDLGRAEQRDHRMGGRDRLVRHGQRRRVGRLEADDRADVGPRARDVEMDAPLAGRLRRPLPRAVFARSGMRAKIGGRSAPLGRAARRDRGRVGETRRDVAARRAAEPGFLEPGRRGDDNSRSAFSVVAMPLETLSCVVPADLQVRPRRFDKANDCPNDPRRGAASLSMIET